MRKLFKGGNYSNAETIRGNTVCWFLAKIIFNFVSLFRKLYNRYYHTGIHSLSQTRPHDPHINHTLCIGSSWGHWRRRRRWRWWRRCRSCCSCCCCYCWSHESWSLWCKKELLHFHEEKLQAHSSDFSLENTCALGLQGVTPCTPSLNKKTTTIL